MIKFENKLNWLIKNLFHFAVASVRIFIYCILNPKQFKKLLFSFYSTVNEFYQVTHGKLIDFEKSEMSKEIKENWVFARSNYFNMDQKVMRPVEVHIIATLTRHLNPARIFEIGTYNGFTTLHFSHNTDDQARIFTLDLPPDYVPAAKDGKLSYDDKLVIELSQKSVHNRAYKGTPHEEKIVELFGDSMVFDYSPYKNNIDLVFIDGNHSFDFVKSDTENAFKMLSARGVILWHDFDYIAHRDVFKYLNELSEDRKIYAIRNTRYAIFGWHL